MQRKPIILILTSKDEIDGVSVKISSAIQKIGTHNAVVMSDDKYGSAAKLSALDKLMDSGKEYQYLLERKDKSVLHDKFKMRAYNKRVNRIRNMVKRFNPEYILCLTPYAQHCATEAKRKAKFSTQIIYMMLSFTVDKRAFDSNTNVFIVENADVKADLVRNGIRSKDIMTMGMPFETFKPDRADISAIKQEYGLPKAKTVFVNVADKKRRDEIYSLLLDQGGFINIVVYCQEVKDIAEMRASAVRVPETTVVFVPNADSFDSYLSVCDIAVTEYDASTIYKCFKLGVPSIVFGEGMHTTNEITYLVSHGLCLRAKDNLEIVGLVYKLLQTDSAREISLNSEKWVEFSSLENIANFLVSYIAV